jgi:hypothetical protein
MHFVSLFIQILISQAFDDALVDLDSIDERSYRGKKKNHRSIIDSKVNFFPIHF